MCADVEVMDIPYVRDFHGSELGIVVVRTPERSIEIATPRLSNSGSGIKLFMTCQQASKVRLHWGALEEITYRRDVEHWTST